MYVQIVPEVTTQLETESLTYVVPQKLENQIRVGQVCKVPLRNREILGLVLAFSQSAPKLKKDTKIKEISQIVIPSPLLDRQRLKLAQILSSYYQANLSQVIFAMLPPLTENPQFPTTLSYPLKFATKSGTYVYIDRLESRIIFYAQMVKKILRGGRSALVLFPEKSKTLETLTEFRNYFNPAQISLYHGALSKIKRFSQWQRILEGKVKIVIGTRSAIFAPLADLGLIIIDSDDDPSFKEEQAPRYQVKKVAEVLQSLYNANLILGSDILSLENYRLVQKGEYKVLKEGFRTSFVDLRIIDQSKEAGFISNFLENKIRQYLILGKKIVLFVSRRGEGSSYFCQDCGRAVPCPRCALPLTPLRDALVCNHCGQKTEIPMYCPNCESSRLKTAGLGSTRLETEIKMLFKKAMIVRVDKDTPLSSPKIVKQNFDILIGTSKIFDIPNLKAQLTGVLGLDNVLNLPDYISHENVSKILQRLKNITWELLVVQTSNPEHFIWKSLNKEPRFFLERELLLRRKYNFPPFSHLILITASSKNEEKAQGESEKLAQQISRLISKDRLKIELLGPAPSFIYKERDKYRWQIILKVENYPSGEASKVLQLVPTQFKIDVDPISLL